MYYTVYQIENLVNGKTYVGMHQTKDLEDVYLGSGKVIRHAIAKHGRENFRKAILFVFDTPEAMRSKELEIVTEAFVARPDTYNLNTGGRGGWYSINSNSDAQRLKAKASNARQKELAATSPEFREARRLQGVARCEYWHRNGMARTDTFKGRHHTEESKTQMSASHRGKHDGVKNSQYGTVWVRSLTERVSKKVPATELPEYLSNGWVRGRKISTNSHTKRPVASL